MAEIPECLDLLEGAAIVNLAQSGTLLEGSKGGMAADMNVLTVYAHHNPKSFCHAVLEKFSAGLADAGHGG